MGNWLKQSTAVDIKLGPFVDSTDGVTAETGLTISQADVRLAKNGGAWAQKNDTNAATHEENGWYEVALNTTDTNTLGILVVAVAESGALPVWKEFTVLPANVYDSLVSGSDLLDCNASQLGGTAQTGRDIGASVLLSSGTGTGQVTLTSGRVNADVTHIATAAVSTSAAQLGVNVVNFGGSAGTFASGIPAVNATQLSGDSTAADNAEAFFDGTGYVGTNNVIPTVTTLTNAPSDSSGVTTLLSRLTSTRAGYLDNLSAGAVATATKLLNYFRILCRKDSAVATDLSTEIGEINANTGAGTGSYSVATDSQEAIRDRGDAAWITAAGFSTHSAADVWSVATRVLTAGTNIVLAKGTGVTGFNDLSAAQVNAEVDAALADYDPPTKAELDTAESNIRGADSDTIKTISDQIDGLTTSAGPQVLVDTTIASLSSQTSFTLTAGSADNDAYNGAVAIITDQSTATQKAVATILDYVGGSKTITLAADPGIFTMATGDSIAILANISSAPSAATIRAEMDANSTKLASIETDTQDIQSRIPAALVSGRIDASVGAYQSGMTPLQPTTAGRTLDVTATGEAGIDWGNIGSPTTTVNLSGTTISTSQAVASVSGAVGSVTGNVGGNVSGSVGSVTGNVGGNVTGSVGSLATQAKADVNAEVDQALADYDAPTNAEMEARTLVAANYATAAALSTVAGYIDTEVAAIKAKTDNLPASPASTGDVTGVWTTAMTESYAADGATMTPAQALYMLYSVVAEFSIAGTTITCKRLNGTDAMTFTLDDDTNPTSRTRAS